MTGLSLSLGVIQHTLDLQGLIGSLYKCFTSLCFIYGVAFRVATLLTTCQPLGYYLLKPELPAWSPPCLSGAQPPCSRVFLFVKFIKLFI